MDVTLFIAGLVSIVVGIGTIWIAMPAAGRISRDWLRSEAGVLYPLVPLVFLVFGIFTVFKAFGYA